MSYSYSSIFKSIVVNVLVVKHYCITEMLMVLLAAVCRMCNICRGLDLGRYIHTTFPIGPHIASYYYYYYRHHRSNGDCLEGKRGNYQVCSVQYCVEQLCTVQCTHIRTDLTVLWIGFCLIVPISLCLDSLLFTCTACMCRIVTW